MACRVLNCLHYLPLLLYCHISRPTGSPVDQRLNTITIDYLAVNMILIDGMVINSGNLDFPSFRKVYITGPENYLYHFIIVKCGSQI